MMGIFTSPTYERAKAGLEMSALRIDFANHFGKSGHIKKPSVKIIDAKNFDPSTRFIGSHTSVLKPDIYADAVPLQGVYIVQDTLRTKNLATFSEGKAPIARPSAFECHGLLSQYGDLNAVVRTVDAYFSNVLGIGECIIYQVNPVDSDLLQALSCSVPQQRIEVGTLPLEKTRHSFGDDRLSGRDIRIVMKGKPDRPCAVIVAMGVDGISKYLETTIAPCTLLQQAHQLEHCLDTFPVPEIDSQDPISRRMFEDCLITTDMLTAEGLIPGGSENKRKLLRCYFSFMSQASRTLGLSHNQTEGICVAYQVARYGNPNLADRVMAHLPRNPQTGLG